MQWIHLSGGAWFFLAFVVSFLVAIIYSLYTVAGSAIHQRPYGNAYTDAPGARGASVLSHDESAATRYTRGTRG